MPLTNQRPNSKSASVSTTNALFVAQDPIQAHIFALSSHISLVSSNLGHFLSLSLPFMTVTLLKITEKLVHGMSLSLGLSEVSS